MTDLQKQSLVSVAHFKYGSQEDLAKLIRLIDPTDVELSLVFMANTSDRFRELYGKVKGSGTWQSSWGSPSR